MDSKIRPASQEIMDVAMSIIMDAGDARLEIMNFFRAMAAGNFEECEVKLPEARQLLAKAHSRQTEIIQSESEGALREHPLLFIHAQDTLMTVNSELNICSQMLGICKNYEARLTALEKRE